LIIAIYQIHWFLGITTAADLGISANRPDIDDGTSVDKKENDIEDDDEDLDLLSLL